MLLITTKMIMEKFDSYPEEYTDVEACRTVYIKRLLDRVIVSKISEGDCIDITYMRKDWTLRREYSDKENYHVVFSRTEDKDKGRQLSEGGS